MKRIRLSSRFGFNLWQIAASLELFGSETRFATGASPNIREFEHMLHGIRLVHGSRGDPPKFITGRKYDLANFPNINMKDYVKPTPISTEFTILHVRGGDYLTQMPKKFLRTADYYARACEKIGVCLDSCRVLTDDPEYAKHLLPHCVQLDTETAAEAFCLMVGARHLVPAGSQFSFWANFLRG